MAVSVRIEDEAFADVRFVVLGEVAGYNEHEALGRMARLWRHCTQRAAYVCSEAVVRSCLGPRGVEAIVEAELGERVEGGVRVRGTSGRIEWLGELRESKVAAGRARASLAERDGRGRLVSRASPAEPAGIQQSHQQASSTRPAESSAPAPAPALTNYYSTWPHAIASAADMHTAASEWCWVVAPLPSRETAKAKRLTDAGPIPRDVCERARAKAEAKVQDGFGRVRYFLACVEGERVDAEQEANKPTAVARAGPQRLTRVDQSIADAMAYTEAWNARQQTK